MNIRLSRWQVFLILQAVIVGLALGGVSLRRSGPGRCALDGLAIEPLYRVRVDERDGESRVFCCIRCAELWLAQAEPPRAVFVTDEASGEEIPARQAWFVRSSVVTQPATMNRIHAFKNRADAERHAATARGRLLKEEDRPLRIW